MNKHPKKLLIFGDSGVYGWGDIEGGGWCERLRREWMNYPNAPVIYQLGVRGDGLENVAKRALSEFSVRGELRRQVPEGILISVGLNDSARIGRKDGRPQLSSEAYQFGMHQLLSGLKTKANVMVVGLTPVDEVSMPFAECLWYSNETISVYESQLEETCLELDLPFFPLHNLILSESNWIRFLESDGIHLNAEGHNWIYERISSWSTLLSWSELEVIASVTV